MTTTTLTTKTYSKFLSDIQKILTQGKAQATRAVNQVLIETYWSVGKRISKENAGERVLKNLAQDLAIEYTLLTRIQKLYFLWPKSCPAGQPGQLSWAHYKELLSVKGRNEREFYLKQAIKNNWSRNKLGEHIKDDYYLEHKKGAPRAGADKLKRKDNPFYLYRAAVDRVIDGDTIWVSIDLGFSVWVKQKLRLRGIDTEELGNSDLAQKAKDFVEAELDDLDFIVLQSYRQDKYGRYEADVFYLKGETDKEVIAREGRWLNQVLLDKKLALKV